VAATAHLRAVDHSSGELVEATPEALAAENQALSDEVKGLQRNILGWTRKCGDLERDHQAEAEANKHWPTAVRMFAYHGKMCNHEEAEWTWQRFEMCLPFLKSKKHGLEGCLQAIAGARYDCWKKRRRNGTYFRRDRWDDIFGKAADFEDFKAKAPVDWTPPEGVLS
jgi:hypothetical protein